MRAPKFFRLFSVGFLLLTLLIASARAADSTNSPEIDPKSVEAVVVSNQEALRANLQIQEQLHDALLAIEKNRREAEAASARNAELLEARLSLLEKTLASQRQSEFQSLESSDRMMVIAAGVFAAVGFLVLIAAALLQWTGANRLANLAASVSAARTTALDTGEVSALASKALEEANTRFLGIVERLEQRVQGLESGAPAPQKLPAAGATQDGTGNAPASSEAAPVVDKAEEIKLLLGKGQTLLKLDQPDAALVCFEEILAMEPDHAEALLKKGAALERLQRLDEAIECYDRAIARDQSMTMAYLYKGGVFNRLERYSEALACYEQALKSQQKGQAANVIMD